MDETTIVSFEAGMIMESQSKITTITSFDSDLNSTLFENTTQKQLPIDMRFNNGHLLAVIVYPILMFVSAVGNLAVLSSIVRLRFKGKLSRIHLLVLHLTIADLLVTFIMMPLEIGWNATVSWHGGDTLCRIMSFLRIFGLYLSGFVLICISIDRYFAVMKPLAIYEANRRARIMISVAWIGSFVCSLPQAMIFRVLSHPKFPWYEQCITFNSFPSKNVELAYNLLSLFFLYALPMLTIIFCYTRISMEIHRVNSQNGKGEMLRRSSNCTIGRARIRMLKMTVIIVATFFFCWTPNNVMSLWHWFDTKSAQEVDPLIQKGLFMFACTNSCVNPLIYGLFHFRKGKKVEASSRSANTNITLS